MSYVTFTPILVSGAIRPVTVLLGPGSPVVSGDGGWAILARPRKKGFTAWEGFTPLQLSINLMFDGLGANKVQEPEFDALSNIMRTRVGTANQPSPVRLGGNVPGKTFSWIIQALEADSDSIIRRAGDGKILRVAAKVSMIEYVEGDVAVSTTPSPAKRVNTANPRTAASGRTHTVKRGDTLSGIAVKYLGSWKRYTEIATLNGIRDPNRVPVGTVLKIP